MNYSRRDRRASDAITFVRARGEHFAGNDAALPTPKEGLEGLARRLVGEMTLRDALQSLRVWMLAEALQTNGGSRSAAARVLGVTRPAVQRMLRELAECDRAIDEAPDERD